ncbi:MAG: hypothetical protein U9N53_08465 [Bacteroidota bacterium]|nr:hypothetical protein [Bacteroidota bacterium]
MDNQNTKLMVAAALGTVGGLLLGLYLWGPEEKKGKLSRHLSTLSSVVKELEEVKSEETKDLVDKISKLIKSVEKGIENG